MRGSSHRTILGAAVAGASAGLLFSYLGPHSARDVLVDGLFDPIGQLFLRLLFVLAVPIVFAALVTGSAELETASFGRLGRRTLLLTLLSSISSVLLGFLLVHLVRPGSGVDAARLLDSLGKTPLSISPAESVGTSEFLRMIPQNPIRAAADGDMMGVIVFSLLFGLALGRVKTSGAEALRRGIQGLLDTCMLLLSWVLRLAPIGMFCLLCTSFSRMGLGLLGALFGYVVTVVLGLALQAFAVYPLMLKAFSRVRPLDFYRSIRRPLSTAFATASSSATLAVALDAADQDLKLPRASSRFVLTAGASMNQNGTALFEGVTVLFLAQAFQIELGIIDQISVLLVAVLGGIGTAGIPSASLPVIALLLTRVGVPSEALVLILGVDRLLDMCRTTLNVAGDLVIASCVAQADSESPDSSSGEA